jgi:hypothetical protein
MKLDYLDDESLECGLFRLYDFTIDEAGRLRDAITQLASGAAERIEINRLPFVEPIGGCRLYFVRRSWDQAVVRVSPSTFECGFTAGTWENVAGLIEPFTESAAGFQWLAGSPGEAEVLLSASGQW